MPFRGVRLNTTREDMNKLLLTTGCSFSALYYHSNPRDSYTVRLAEALDYKLLQLAHPGGGIDTIYRTLRSYLKDPIHGVPDFVFVQMPFSDRKEYWFDLDNEDTKSRVLNEINTGWRWCTTDYPQKLTGTGRFNTGGITAQEQDWWQLEQTLVAMLETHKGIDPSENNWQFYMSSSRISNKHEQAHLLLHQLDASQRMIHIHTYAHLIEQLLESYAIPYAYTESDYVMNEPMTSTFDNNKLINNKQVQGAYNYIHDLPHKKHFIPEYSIAHGSSTWQNDNYKCEHPGPQSHYHFFRGILPHIKKRIN